MHILKTQGLSDSDKAARPTRKLLQTPDSTPKTWRKKDKHSHAQPVHIQPPALAECFLTYQGQRNFLPLGVYGSSCHSPALPGC